MFTVRELKALATRLDATAFELQLGPFVLVERPFKKERTSGALDVSPKATRPLMGGRAQKGVLDFDDLWVATLPPLRARALNPSTLAHRRRAARARTATQRSGHERPGGRTDGRPGGRADGRRDWLVGGPLRTDERTGEMTDGRAGGWMDAKEGEELTPKFGE